MALLTTTTFKEHFETDLATAAIQRHLDETEALIVREFGANTTDLTEWLEGMGRYIFLSRVASSVTTTVETVSDEDTTLASDDYRLEGQGRRIKRLSDGTNGRVNWGDLVKVIYTPSNETSIRIGVQLDLVKLEIQFKGLKGEKIGDWGGNMGAYDTERAAILGRLRRGATFA